MMAKMFGKFMLLIFPGLGTPLFIMGQNNITFELKAPTDLKVRAGSGSHLNLSWSDNSVSEEGYFIERKKKGQNYWEIIGFVPDNSTVYQSGGCMANTTYFHRIKAYKGDLYGNYSKEVEGTTLDVLNKQQSMVIEASNQRQGESTFIKVNNGDLNIYFGSFLGVGDRTMSRIAQKISKDNGQTWEKQHILFQDSAHSLFHPSVVRISPEKIGIAYSKKIPNQWKAWKVFRYSSDEGKTWSEEIKLSDQSYRYTTGSHDRFVRLSNGRILHVLHGITNANPAGKENKRRTHPDSTGTRGYGINGSTSMRQGRQLGTDIYSTDDQGLSWYKLNQETLLSNLNPYGLGEYGFYEASIVEWGRQLIIFGRNATGNLYVARSSDYGKTWDKPKPVGIQNPLAPIRAHLIPGTSSIILLQCPIVDLFGSWGNGPRFVLASRVSHDGGITWTNYKELEHDGIHHYAYPSIYFYDNDAHIAYWKTTLENNRWKKIELAYRKLQTDWFLDPKRLAE